MNNRPVSELWHFLPYTLLWSPFIQYQRWHAEELVQLQHYSTSQPTYLQTLNLTLACQANRYNDVMLESDTLTPDRRIYLPCLLTFSVAFMFFERAMEGHLAGVRRSLCQILFLASRGPANWPGTKNASKSVQSCWSGWCPHSPFTIYIIGVSKVVYTCTER